MSHGTAWVYLIVAGLVEIAWALGIKYSQGFTKLVPSVFTAVTTVVSIYMLGRATEVLPIGTAYGIWVGIGTIGAAVFGVYCFGEPMTFWRIFFLALLTVSLVGLKLTSVS